MIQFYTDSELLSKERLIEALLAANTPELMKSFVNDLMTPREQDVFTKKLYIVYKLFVGAPYKFIEDSAKTTSRTISTISKQIKDPNSGFSLVFPLLYPKEFGPLDGVDHAFEEFKKSLTKSPSP